MDFKIQNLNKKLGSFMLKNIEVNINKGEIVGLIGHNGAGKTTLINLILNAMKRDSGDIIIMSKDNIEHERYIKENIGVVIDDKCFVDEWTIKDIEKIYRLFYKKWDSNKFYLLLDKLEVPLSCQINHLSKGNITKLKIATALSREAKILIFDEPTSGLDPKVRSEVLEILSDYAKNNNVTIIFSTHIISDIEKICDFIIFIDQGSVKYFGRKQELLNKYKLIKGNVDSFDQIKDTLIGYKKKKTDFEGLIINEFNSIVLENYAVSNPTLEDIMLLLSNKKL